MCFTCNTLKNPRKFTFKANHVQFKTIVENGQTYISNAPKTCKSSPSLVNLIHSCQNTVFLKKTLTQLKNHAFSELRWKEPIILHHAAKFGVKRLKVKLMMDF